MPSLVDRNTTAEMIEALRIRKVETIFESFFINQFSLATQLCCGLKAVVIWKKCLRHFLFFRACILISGVLSITNH